MLEKASVIGFIPVRDLRAAEEFYGGRLGLQVVGNDGFALVLRSGTGTVIRCVLTPDIKSQPFTILGWEVLDISATVKELRAAGVQPKIYPHFEQNQDGVWTAPEGSEVVWFNDPSGNVLSLSRHGAVAR
jgi:catechol 2,3-dioxygenase-like lactoylglutathione lyase family enzyme